MNAPQSRHLSIWLWIVPFALIIGAAVICLVLVPLVECPLCHGGGRFYELELLNSGGVYASYRCDFCNGARRVSPFKKWNEPWPVPKRNEDRRLDEAPPQTELRNRDPESGWYWRVKK